MRVFFKRGRHLDEAVPPYTGRRRLQERPDAGIPRTLLPTPPVDRYARGFPITEASMAKKTVLVSDMSGQEIEEGKGATIRIVFRDARKGVRELDVTDAEAERLGGRQVKRR